MSLNLKYPGVYIQELPSGVHPIMGVSTSLTAFIGEAMVGPVNKATLINSFADFERIFGGLSADLNLGYAVSQYFTNGGQQAIIVRVVGKKARKAQFEITDATGANVLSLEAKSEGEWANPIVDNNGTVTSFVDTGLTNGIAYSYKITAINSEGESPPASQPNVVPTAPIISTNPLSLKAVGGFKQVALSWQAPASNGGASISSYNIYRGTAAGGEDPHPVATVDGSTTSYIDTGLTNGNDYYYKITAVNVIGESPSSDESHGSPIAQLTKPLNPTTIHGDGQIVLSWQAPASNGGASISSYNIYRGTAAGGEDPHPVGTAKGSSTSYTDTGLTNGDDYYYKITAVNVIGESPRSDEVNDTPSVATAPSQPSALTAVGGFKQVALSWQAPASNGGTSISSYNIYRGTAAGGEDPHPVATVDGSTTSYIDTGLTNGIKYYYTIKALNTVGPSLASNEAYDTPSATMTAPLSFSATPGNKQVALSWQAPASNGGLPIVTYMIYRSVAGNTTAFTLAGKIIGGLNIVADNNTRNSKDQTLFNLTITNVTTGTKETLLNLSTDKTNSRYVGNILDANSNLIDLANDAPATLQFNPISPSGFGYIFAVPVNAGIDVPATATEILGDKNDKKGIYALEKVDIFNLLCIPPYGLQGDNVTPNSDIDYADILEDVVAYCNTRRAIFLVDSPTSWESSSNPPSSIQIPTTDIISLSFPENAAIFFPRVNMADQVNQGRMREFVPCGAIAGAIARIDGQRGIWKAPAGIEATLGGVVSLSYSLTDGDNGVLNPQGINCLRTFPEIGSVIWGSRTLKGADILADQWKYLPVRRLALYIEGSLLRGTQWVVFEPNDEPLWSQIRLNVGSFMQDLFRKGAFQGSTPKEAYFVRCDSTTTTSDDQDKGIVNIIVGFAPLKPAEFVVIKIQQIAGQGAAG